MPPCSFAGGGTDMRYVSTRGQSPAIGFWDAVLAGLAPDGGLYIPEAWPRLEAEEIAAFARRPLPRGARGGDGKVRRERHRPRRTAGDDHGRLCDLHPSGGDAGQAAR